MKFLSKIKDVVSRLPRKTLLTIAGLTLLISTPIVVKTFAEFYPDRPAFDYNKPCNPDDGDIYDRCGSLTGPVFNSFINTPSYGDERAFLDARRSDQTASGSYKNVLSDVTGGSKEVVVRMYIHNNANQSTNESGLGIARNTTVKVALPSGTSQALRARGYISASNAASVEDTVDFTAGEEFSVSYVPGSAILYDNDNFAGGVTLGDSIVTSGTQIGSDALNGNMKGCFEFEAVVQIKVKVTPKANPNVKLTKEVRKKGETQWKKEVNAKPGEEVEWLITTENTGQAVLNNNIVRDVLPPHVQLKSGSVKWIDASQNAVQGDAPLFDGGINVGNYAPGSGFYMMFATNVLGDFEPCQIRVRNIAYEKSDQVPEIQDDADVVITRENCEQPVTPVYRCDSIQKQFLEARKYRFTTKVTAENGATIKQYRYVVTGNNNYKVEQISNQANGTFDHNFPGPGDYVVAVTADFNVNGQVQSDTGELCKTSINFPKEEDKCPLPGKQHLPKNSPECKDTPVVTTTGTKLPNTGPGDVVGMFVATTVAATLAHKFILSKRYQ